LNYLCAGYKMFFNHIGEPMKLMATALQAGKPADSIMPLMREQKHGSTPPGRHQTVTTQRVGRNSPCPCGSGRKYKQCCLGKNT
jgi:uncharacterized protein